MGKHNGTREVTEGDRSPDLSPAGIEEFVVGDATDGASDVSDMADERSLRRRPPLFTNLGLP